MKIIKCAGCGRHIYMEGSCPFCGGISAAGEVMSAELDSRAAESCRRTEDLVKGGHFDEALAQSEAVIEWMPDLADIYWLRLLARRQAVNTVELLAKGFSEETDADFANALRCASGVQKEMFEQLAERETVIRDLLRKEINAGVHSAKQATHLAEVNAETQGQIEAHRQKLFDAWSALEAIEQQMYVLEKDAALQTAEQQNSMQKALEDVTAARSEIYALELCKEDQFNRAQVRLSSDTLLSEQARAEVEEMKKTHPLVQQYAALAVQRDQQQQKVQAAVSDLKKYEESLQKLVTKVEKLEKNRRMAQMAADQYRFPEAVMLSGLGRAAMPRILHQAGVIAD